MSNVLASFWHEIVFWWAVVMTLVVLYDHADKVRILAEWAALKLRDAQSILVATAIKAGF